MGKLWPKTTGHSLAKEESELYGRYCGVFGRCYQPSNSSYCRYGAKGIKVCEEWRDFPTFVKWMKEHGFTNDCELELDRIDGTKGYEPSNCRLVTRAENKRNCSNNVWYNFNGKKTCQTDIMRQINHSRDYVKNHYPLWTEA